MTSRRLFALNVAAATATAAPLAQPRQKAALAALQTRAERSAFRETSRYDDVQQFLATVDQASDLPRYTHNYWGLRNRFGILNEAYSYLPVADRVTTTRRFVEEVLGYAHRHAARLRDMAAAADAVPWSASACRYGRQWRALQRKSRS